MATADRTQMTQKERRGQTIVATYIAAVLAISLIVITLYVSTRGLEHLPARAARFALTGLLCLFLYRGSNLARGINIVLFGVTGVFATETAFEGGGHVMAMAFMGTMGVIYLTFAVVLIASPAVSAFLAYQRESLPQKSTFERHRVGKVFLLRKNTILKPHHRLTLVIPARMRDALNCESSGEIALSADGEKVHIRLDVGSEAWMSESSQAFVLPWCDGETAAKLIQLTPMPKAAETPQT